MSQSKKNEGQQLLRQSLMLEVPCYSKYCVLSYGYPYFLTDYNLLLAVQTLEIGRISCGISHFGQHKQSISPAVEKDMDHSCLSHALAHQMFLEKVGRKLALFPSMLPPSL